MSAFGEPIRQPHSTGPFVDGRPVRCISKYGLKSLTIMRGAKERGMHLTLDGDLVLPSGKVHKRRLDADGRDTLNLSVDGFNAKILLARVICFLVYGEPPTTDSVVDHIDGNPSNDHPDNLRWASYSENTRNSSYARKKTWERVVLETCAGLTDSEVVAMRELWERSKA